MPLKKKKKVKSSKYFDIIFLFVGDLEQSITINKQNKTKHKKLMKKFVHKLKKKF